MVNAFTAMLTGLTDAENKSGAEAEIPILKQIDDATHVNHGTHILMGLITKVILQSGHFLPFATVKALSSVYNMIPNPDPEKFSDQFAMLNPALAQIPQIIGGSARMEQVLFLRTGYVLMLLEEFQAVVATAETD
eukprot:3595421-Karenia_brevis.AAC.1